MLRVPPSSQWLCQLAFDEKWPIYWPIWPGGTCKEESQVLAGEQLQHLAADDADERGSICVHQRHLRLIVQGIELAEGFFFSTGLG